MGDQDYNPQERRAKRRKHELVMKCVISVLVLAVVVMLALLVKEVAIPEIVKLTAREQGTSSLKETSDAGVILSETADGADTASAGLDESTENASGEDADSTEGTSDSSGTDTGAADGISTAEESEIDAVLMEAENLAAMYDYDGAVECVQASEYYETSELLQQAVASYEKTKASCVSWSPEEVTHIFFHLIIWDASKAFDGDLYAEGYNQYMVTMDEFSAIMQTMYDEGYVMVSMHDMCEVNEDGTVTRKEILLPEGKTPFVLSQDDVCYYHYMDGDGFASRLVLDENGDVKAEYIEDDGTVSVGDYDLIPWIDTFVDLHPDFTYHGHKGTIALTGYEGILGYRTDEVYLTRDEDRLTSWQKAYLEENPDFDEEAWQAEVDAATAVADALKADGWEFASHTWGHIDPIAKGLEGLQTDTERWKDNVETIVGETDIIIFAFGADISNWTEYSEDNEYYIYLKEQGYNIFCCVDSTQYWVQFNGTSMRMGRRDIDGYRMYYNADLLSDLFNVSDVWDALRPDTVAELSEYAGTMSSEYTTGSDSSDSGSEDSDSADSGSGGTDQETESTDY
ncbi:MAG: polysaccharide deacetylase [Lachnospiraceae bacterium]|nr:polysaccharide deacetylase [Lachnospiraceae bacterium]MCD7841419.1 polysaccharide deacetylase [Lachnospiraceae bacterium]